MQGMSLECVASKECHWSVWHARNVIGMYGMQGMSLECVACKECHWSVWQARSIIEICVYGM